MATVPTQARQGFYHLPHVPAIKVIVTEGKEGLFNLTIPGEAKPFVTGAELTPSPEFGSFTKELSEQPKTAKPVEEESE
jgi:hypothetical protein